MTLDLLRAELDELATHRPIFDGKPYALFGSLVMQFWGILDRPLGDVDVFVAPTIWADLAARDEWQLHLPDPADPPFLARRIASLNVHAFYRWTGKDPEVNADECRLRAEQVHGWWCTPLELIRRHKALSIAEHPGSERHEKHGRDVAVIDEALTRLHGDAWAERDRDIFDLLQRTSRLVCPIHGRDRAVLSVCRCGQVLIPRQAVT